VGFCGANNTCLGNHTGVLCGSCEPGLRQLFLTPTPCVQCKKPAIGLMVGLMVVIWAFVILVVLCERFENTAKLKIVLSFLQSLPLVLGPQFRSAEVLRPRHARGSTARG
jgi:hypothetical protein